MKHLARRTAIAWLLVLGLLLPPPAARAQEPSDEQLRVAVLNAIDRGQQALLKLQLFDGSWSGDYPGHEVGLTSLATLALLNSGLTKDHPGVRSGLNFLKSRVNSTREVYDASMLIMALAASGDPDVQGRIAILANFLEQMQSTGQDVGGWAYNAENRRVDNSNSQYAILGLHAAAMAGTPVSEEVLIRARDYFLKNQTGPRNLPTGFGWSYQPGQGGGNASGSMTSAGIGSLAMIRSLLPDNANIAPDGTIDCCAPVDDAINESIDSGVQWLARHFRVDANPNFHTWNLYYLYGLERVGRFTGRRFIGDHDWYREGAKWLIEGQSPQESIWSDSNEPRIVGTSFALLFLSKGMAPVVINKLEFGPRDAQGKVVTNDWNRHSRDIMNLVDYTATLPGWPQLMTWQIVDLRTAAEGEGVAALLQSPIQFLSGTRSPAQIQGRELELLREYLAQGGFLLAVNNCDSPEFDAGFKDLVNRLFEGQFPLTRLSPTHDVYRSEHVFEPTAAPELWGVDFGCRTAVIYAQFDHACRWDKWIKHDFNQRPLAAKTQIDKSMRLGVNIIAYATGRELQDKLERPEMLAADEGRNPNRGEVRIARLRHTGGWDTAPHALRRLQASLETVKIVAGENTPTLAANDPSLFEYPLVYMHGRTNFQFTPEEREQLKVYLENGGFLFADACCGAPRFDASFREQVQQMFGRPLEPIPLDHEIYNLELGQDLRNLTRRVPAEGANVSSLTFQKTVGPPVLEGIKVEDKYVLIYSKYDISCALERQATNACAGYPTEDAIKLATNLVMYGLVR